MASINKIIISGNIAQEIEVKQTAAGTSVCTFSVAVNRYSKDTEKLKADFHTVVAWSQKAEFVGKYFSKGKPILISGRLENREWTDKNGNKRVSTEIIAEDIYFMGSTSESATEAKNTASTAMPAAYGGNANYEELPTDGDLPF